MAVEAVPSWETLPRETREVIEWAKACELSAPDVGTRALLIGILRAGGGASPADDLLRHFGVSHEQLYQALQLSEQNAIDPRVRSRRRLSRVPSLTDHAQFCMIQANELRVTAGRPSIDPDCLFGAILQSYGTARAGLARVLAEVSIDEICTHYLSWLWAGSTGSYAEALAVSFPMAAPVSSGVAPDSEIHLITLLRRQTRDGSPYRGAGLSILIADELLLTTVAPSVASHALLASGSVQELEWIGADSGLAAALLDSSGLAAGPLTIRNPGPGDRLRCYAMSDDGAALRVLTIRPLAVKLLSGNSFILPLASEVPSGYSLIGSPVLDSSDDLVGMIQSVSVEGLQVIGGTAIEQFLVSLGILAAADAPASVAIGTSSGAGNDVVASTDQLGFDVYVEAFADLIMSEHTKPPLTIGIFGSWGMGKSFLLEHIRLAIKRRQEDGVGSGPTIHTVRFNAWEYSATDAIWPALVRKIVKELDQLASWPRRKRIWTRLRWNLRREWRPLWIKLVTAGLVLAIAAAVAVGKHGLAVGLGGLTALLGIGGLVKAANDPVAKWVTGLFAGSDYGGQLRLMEDIKHDLDLLERRLHVAGDPDETQLTGRILVIIDDLDRCEPAKAVEVLQAVNLLLNFSSFIVCLGIDARIVTAAIEKHYEGLLGVAGASGYEYLDKIVQIPFRIPEPGSAEITEFIRSQLAVPVDSSQPDALAGSSAGAAPSGDGLTNAAQGGPRVDGPDLAVRDTELAPANPEASPAASVLPLAEVLFTMDEQRAFELFVDYLRPNPRHLKRLINVYRLVRSLGLAEGERLVLDRPAAVLRWLIMWAQWPLTSSMLLRLLDSVGAGAGDRPPDTDPMLSLLDQVERLIDRKARADRDDDPRKLRGLLEVPGCVLSADEIRRIRRYTVNFNPAIEEQLRGGDSDRPEVLSPAREPI